MLEYIHLLNFQKHKDFYYTFSPNTSYLTGVNGCGKSTILRAIMWVSCTCGDSKSFIRTFEDNGDICTCKEVSAEIGVDGHVVRRVYSSSKNEYYVDGLKITGFGKSVPEEVSSIFRMSALNYSEQFSPLFLLNDSGNSLATELGEVASLEEMDELSDSINSCIRAKTVEVDNIEEACSESTKKMKAIDGLPITLAEMDETLLNDINEYKERELETFELTNICSELEKRKDLSYIKDILDSLEPPITLFNDDVYLADLIHITNRLKEIPPISQSVVDSLVCDINMSDFEMEDIGELENTVNSLRNIDMENERDKKELDSINNQLNSFSVCPYCNSSLENHTCHS